LTNATGIAGRTSPARTCSTSSRARGRFTAFEIGAAWIAPHVFCDLPDDECAANVFAAIGLPSIAAGTVAGVLVDAAIKKTIFQFTGTRGSVSPVLGGRRAGVLATLRF
jgi:hypothetical protein